MDGFLEIEFVGRGGQGAKTAAEIVARHALSKGKYIQSFPDYGPERKGAPVRAFTRVSDSEIRGCSSDADPEILVIIDSTLLKLNGTLFTLREGQTVIINSEKSPDELKEMLKFMGNIYSVNATRIALDLLGSAITNTTMLGAFAKITGFMSLDELNSEIESEFRLKLSEDALKKNFEMTARAYEEVR